MREHRVKAIAAATVAALGLVTGPAFAHTTANPAEQPADGFGKIDFRVPHGCDEEPTSVLTVQIPEGVVSVKPEMIPGWTTETEIGPYDEPVTLHGQELTEGVRTVTWTAEPGNELPNSMFMEFGITAKLPAGEGPLYFPAVQTCPSGAEEAWIEIPAEGQTSQDLDKPAPSVTLVAADGGHGAATGDEVATGASAEGDDAVAAALTSSEDERSDALPIAALVVGSLGLVAGVGALAASRRRS